MTFKTTITKQNFQNIKQVHKTLGSPEEIQTSTIAENSTTEKYGDTTFQVDQNGSITATMTKPKGDETKLQYWFHYWGNEFPEKTPNIDGTITYRTKISKQAVIFDTKTEKVVRIIKL